MNILVEKEVLAKTRFEDEYAGPYLGGRWGLVVNYLLGNQKILIVPHSRVQILGYTLRFSL